MSYKESINIIDKLYDSADISRDDLSALLFDLLGKRKDTLHHYLFSKARLRQMQVFGKDIYKRGLIEISNYCVNDCFYCGIRHNNSEVCRYRLTEEEILETCAKGYELGMRTFVLQGGEDPFYKKDEFTEIIRRIKREYPDCAITLSLGEQDRERYQLWFDAGADRYLLRHETASEKHYEQLHPAGMKLENRKKCLFDLKDIGYQVGAGFMVGSPYQTSERLVMDIEFLQELEPHMVGIGPFIPHKNTEYKDCESGSMLDTMVMLAIVRLLLPKALLPSTTALGTLEDGGYENGILAGANVVMFNLTPKKGAENYELYDGKVKTGRDTAERMKDFSSKLITMGYELVSSRGDHEDKKRETMRDRG